MDSVKETINQALQNKKTSLHSSDDEERFPCPHGTMVRKGVRGELLLWECGKCEKEQEEERMTRETMSAKVSRFNGFMWNSSSSMNIPKRFVEKTLDNFIPKTKEQKTVLSICKKYVENFESAMDNGTSLIFCGKPGTGKTHLSYAIVSMLRELYITASVVTASNMTSEIKEAYKSDITTPREVTEKFSEYDLLVIDEVGVQVDSGPEKRIFFEVINKRYENMLPTVMISNLELQELSKFVGDRVMDRMKENGGVVFAFDWASYRK